MEHNGGGKCSLFLFTDKKETMRELIKKYLQEQVIDKAGETRPYTDPESIDVYADDIEKLVKINADSLKKE